jgi:hypothetical protein
MAGMILTGMGLSLAGASLLRVLDFVENDFIPRLIEIHWDICNSFFVHFDWGVFHVKSSSQMYRLNKNRQFCVLPNNRFLIPNLVYNKMYEPLLAVV